MAATPDKVRPNKESICSLVRPIGLSMSENSRRCTMGSPDPSNRSIYGILNLSDSVTAVSVYPSSMFGMDFTPWDFLNSFSSLFSFSAVGSTSNSKEESGRLVGIHIAERLRPLPNSAQNSACKPIPSGTRVSLRTQRFQTTYDRETLTRCLRPRVRHHQSCIGSGTWWPAGHERRDAGQQQGTASQGCDTVGHQWCTAGHWCAVTPSCNKAQNRENGGSPKGMTTRTYFYEGPTTKDKEATELFHDGVKQSGQDSAVTEIGAHPRHKNQMKPHQVEGFNFLLSNFVAENRGGYILAHAPLPLGAQTVGRSEKNTFPGVQATLIEEGRLPIRKGENTKIEYRTVPIGSISGSRGKSSYSNSTKYENGVQNSSYWVDFGLGVKVYVNERRQTRRQRMYQHEIKETPTGADKPTVVLD
ncbi:hypothetical protein HYC85_030049 [Camellia sinensis]|uniref:Uncharacterized protein n=1 Tax=Camellia sinensis TaxID=4442 RepID=A0A7J7G2G8_CAMSI|nr:hypothetical protein HYC85_030049 [Camellia sinensis]